MTVPVLVSSTKVLNSTVAPNPVLLVPAPAGLALGNLMTLGLYSYAAATNSGTDTLPSANWNASTSHDSGTGIKSTLYWCIATATEVAVSAGSGTFSFTRGTGGSVNSLGATAILDMITGAHPTNPLAVTPTVNPVADNQSTLTWPAITTTSADNLIVYKQSSFCKLANESGTSWPNQGPAGTTVSSGAIINDAVTTLFGGTAYVGQAAAGTVASTTKSLSDNNDGIAACFTLAIAPAVGLILPPPLRTYFNSLVR